MSKQVEMGLDAQKNFTEMDKNRDVKDEIWGDMMKLDSPMKKKTPKKIRSQD